MHLRRLAYISRTRTTVVETDLRQILGLAEVLHRRSDLTGVLAYTGHHFFQVIEGAAADVETLLELIRADARHDQIRVLCDELVSLRQFDRWRGVFIDSFDLSDQIKASHTEATGDCERARHLTEQIVAIRD